MISVKDPLGQQNNIAYDLLDRVISSTDPLARSLKMAYDNNGNATAFTDASGLSTAFSYDSRDRLIARTDPLNQTESISYNAAGDPVSRTDRQSQTSTQSYDALGRLTQSTYPDGSLTRYTYDAGSRLTSVQDYAANGALTQTITRSYDGNNQLIHEQSSQGTLDYNYDLSGKRTSLTVAGQPTVNYGYNANGQLTQISQGTQQVSISYDALGRRQQLTLPNGVIVNYDFDDGNQLTGMTYTKADSTPLGNLSYSYDNAGRRTGQGGSLANTLLPAATVNNATHDAANRLIAWNGAALSHDPNGNLTSDGTQTYLWDARQHLSLTFNYAPMLLL